MKKKTYLSALAVAISALIGACDSDSNPIVQVPPPPPPPPPPLTWDQANWDEATWQ